MIRRKAHRMGRIARKSSPIEVMAKPGYDLVWIETPMGGRANGFKGLFS